MNSTMSRIFPGIQIACLSVAVVLFCGCSVIENSHRQKLDMMNSYMAGKNHNVRTKLEEKLSDKGTFSGSVVNSGDEIMWRLEAGSFYFHTGNYQKSIEQFSIAEKLITEHDERARISVRDAGAEVGAAFTNLNTLPYRGFCRDRMALSIYKSLAYLGCDREESFRAQLRRLRNEQKKIQDDYQEFFAQQTAEIEAAGSKNPDAAAMAEHNSVEALSGNSGNAEFAEHLKAAREVAHKGYGNFLNPAAIFLSGLGSLRDGNYDNARIDFKRLHEAMPKNLLLQKYYVTALQKADREIPENLKNVKPFDFALEHDCVYVFIANGRSAAFKQSAVYFPLMFAWPVCEFYPADFSRFTVENSGRKHEPEILADMDGILAQEYDERLPLMITRIVISTAIKEAARHAATAVAAEYDGLLAAGVYVGTSLYNATMNTADTRSWEMLPKEIFFTQFPMPEKREIKVQLSGSKQFDSILSLPEDCRSAIIFISAPSADNVICHVLPIKSH